MSADCEECAATRAAIGDAWFAGGASAAEAVRRKTRSLEQYRAIVRDYDHRKTALDALTYTLRWLKGELSAQRALGQRVTRLAKRIERMRAAHSALSCEQGEERMARMAEREEPSVCLQQCAHGSECLLPAGHEPPDRHETQHGCIAYDPRTGSSAGFCDDCGAVVGGNPGCDTCCDWVREDAARRRS